MKRPVLSTLIIFRLYSLALCLNCNKVIFFIDMFPFNSSLQDVPIVAKLFAPSGRCSNCGHASDSDFRYCQRYGYNRKILNSGKRTALAIDMDVIDDRVGSWPYSIKRLVTLNKKTRSKGTWRIFSLPFLVASQ